VLKTLGQRFKDCSKNKKQGGFIQLHFLVKKLVGKASTFCRIDGYISNKIIAKKM
tara:strand:- start:58 stop:222 length:165 start_codon:yes stop_codon:yes gene_type:complete